MERLTTRHNGVAVIKDKKKLKDAMEKLAAYEEVEEECDMKALTTEFAECICDKICKYPGMCNQEELDDHCEECRMDKFLSEIIKGYNQLNKFVESQLAVVLEENSVLKRELKKYKDLEEQGLLLKLHFGKGDVVYEVVEGGDGEHYVVPRKCHTNALLIILNEKVGKTVFLTKAEAEKALAEMEK